ncbi:MAG: flagellar basal-body rod protein FlgF [Pseudomonadota bacterium]
MDNSIYALLSGQVALRRQLDSVANNMANLGTTGYKEERMHFDDVYKRLQTDGKGIAFVHDVTSSTNFSQGAFTQTGNQLDVAIQGQAMLSVQDENGQVLYTRDGRFSRANDGSLVLTSNGMRVLDNGGAAIQIPENVNRISIAGDGTVSIEDGGAITRIGLFGYENANMKRLSDGLYSTNAPLEPTEEATISQGFLESSNVNAVKTLTDLINVQRAYERSSNLIDKEDQRIKDTISRLGRAPG